MATLSTLQTPIATKLVNEDGTINHVWNEFFVRFMISAGIKVSIDDLETDTADLQTQIDAVDTEVSAAITMTDYDSNLSATMAKLYNGNKTSDGVSYTVSGTDKYIQYYFEIENYFDRISIWTADANGQVYVAYSTNGTDWSYLSAESDHTLTTEGRLETATSQANAQTDYYQLAAGSNNALFPNNITAKYIRLYITGTYTTEIYELIAARMLIAEMGAINNLAVLSATFGPVGGYDSITDKPTSLGDVNSTEGTKLDGIAEGADVSPGLPSDEDLVGYWSFDENNESFVKEIISGDDTEIHAGNSVGWVTGVSGSAYDFGTTGYVYCDNPVLGSTACTITAWIKPTATYTGRGAFYDWASGSYNLILGYDNGTGLCIFYAGDGTSYEGVINSTLNFGEWNFIVGVFVASTSLALWVNNVEVTQACAITAIGSTQSSFCRLGNKMNGPMDEVRIYDRVLTDDEIKALYLNPGGLKSPKPGADVTDYSHTEGFATVNNSVMRRYGSTIVKTGASAWDGRVYSVNSYIGGARLSFKANQNDGHMMLGFDTSPTDSSSYDIQYAFYCHNTGYIYYGESGSLATLNVAYDTDTFFELVYTGSQIIYYADGVALRTVEVAADIEYYFTTSFYNQDAAASNVSFGPYATNNAYLQTGYTKIIGDVISVYGDTVTITSSINDRIDWIENSTTYAGSLTPGTTYTATTLAAHVQVVMRALGHASTTVTYDTTSQLITIANSSLTTLTLKWNTGTNATRCCGRTLGFDTDADDTGALTYDSDRGCGLRVLIGDLS